MTDTTTLDFSRLLGFEQVSERSDAASSAEVDFRSADVDGRLGAKVGAEPMAPSGVDFRDASLSALGAKVGSEASYTDGVDFRGAALGATLGAKVGGEAA